MLRAAHYKADAVDGPSAVKSPPKHRSGGILDLALTAADKYALSLLPTALKGTGIANNDGSDSRVPAQHSGNGIPPPFKMQRSAGLHTAAATSQEVQVQSGVAGVATSWDASLKEILAALEPETRTLKPAKLRDYKYPNQNHGMPTNAVVHSPRRELDEALIALPGGTRRNKSSVPSYTNGFKGLSRQGRRPELQAMDMQYELVPSVKLAWAGPGSGTYSTTGFGGSPKKYTSQLVGRVSPHYAGTPALQQSMSSPAGNQDQLHLPEIANGNSHGAAHMQGSLRTSSYALPSFQSWSHTATPSTTGHTRRALPYVSTNTPSLAKPLTVQYHPVLKSTSLGPGPGLQYPQPPATSSATAIGARTLQRPATDQGSSAPSLSDSAMPGEPTKLYPRAAFGGQLHRLPQTPPEVAAEVARLRHAQELDGVISGVRSDLVQAAAPRFDPPIKSKFLQMYEDPNRPLAKLNPKQFLGDAPPSQHQRRHRPPIVPLDKSQDDTDGRSLSSTPSGSTRTPMYERRLGALASGAQLDAAAAGNSEGHAVDTADGEPPEIPDGATLDAGMAAEAEALSPERSTASSSLIDREDTELSIRDSRDISDSGGELDTNTGAKDKGRGEASIANQPGPEGVALQEFEGMPTGGAASMEQATGSQRYATQEEEQIQPELPLPTTGVPEVSMSGPPDDVEAAQDSGQQQQRLSGTMEVAAAEEVLEDGSRPQPDNQSHRPSSTLQGSGAVVDERKATLPAATECTPGANQPVAPERTAVTEPSGAGQQDTEPSTLTEPGSAVGPEGAPAPGAETVPVEVGPEPPQVASNQCGLSPGAPILAGATESPVIDQHVAALPKEGVMEGVTEPESLGTTETADIQPAASADMAGVQSTANGGTAVGVPEPDVAPAEMAQEAAINSTPASVDATMDGNVETDGLTASMGIAENPGQRPRYTLPPGVTPEMAKASAICIQSHTRGYQARRRMSLLRSQHQTAEVLKVEVPSNPSPAHPKQVAYELPPGVTPAMARAAIVRIQSHARGYFARRHMAELRRGREAGEAALASAVTAVATRKLEEYELKAGVTAEMAEAAAVRVQAHMRGHLARRRVRRMRAELSPAASGALVPGLASSSEAAGEGDNILTSAAVEEQGDKDAGAESEELMSLPVPPEPEEITIDALKAALTDEEEEQQEQDAEAPGPRLGDGAPEEPATLDMSNPAVVAAAAAAAAAAKGAIRLLDDGGYELDGVMDTTAATDQAAAEANMARLAASSARTSAMFQGAGAEMRFSDDEASALELMDNLDGLLQGDDEAAAAAAAVAAATAPADGELVCISADGVSEPQALGLGSSGGPPPNPMDVTEPGGVRVLAGKYEVQHVVGEGAYGMVMKCKVRGTEPVQWVAIKEFKIDDNDPDAEDVKRTSLREVAVLEALQHPHVVGFVDKFMVGDRLFIVMEFLPCNLLELLEAQPGGMDRDAVRLIMFQLCSAIGFIHSKGMVYRDIKPENLLVDEHGTVKLCDFGFARYLPSGPSSHLTDYVATRWYRAPELLLGPPYRDALGKHIQYMYGPPVDMWAVGCLMGELLDGEPLFAGDSDLDQLYRVQQILGPMTPGHQYMFYANPHNTGIVFNIKQPMTLGARYRGKVSEVELSFMSGLLEMDPDKRLTGEQCLQHPYLADLAAAANVLPVPPTITDTPTATNPNMEDGGSGDIIAQDGDMAVQLATQETGDEPSTNGEVATDVRGQVSGTPLAARLSESREGLGSRGVEKVGSLTRAAGSLSRGGRSVSRGSISPVLMPPVSSSPVPGPGPQRGASKLHATENGEVVIVEGVEEEEVRGVGSGMAGVKSVSALLEVAAGVSEIEPLE